MLSSHILRYSSYLNSSVKEKSKTINSMKGLSNDCVLRVATNFHDTILKSEHKFTLGSNYRWHFSGDRATNRLLCMSAVGTSCNESQERSRNLSQNNWKIFENFATCCRREIIEVGLTKKIAFYYYNISC